MAREMDLIRSQHDFQFTRRWFILRNLPTFREYIFPEWAGKPITYLELGVFEGMSLVWMLQHVLINPASRAVGIDPWLMTTKLDEGDMEAVRGRAIHNTLPWEKVGMYKCILQRGNSAEVLRKMCGRGGFLGIKKESVDISMVDGNHNALAVVDDCRHVYRLLKPGGWMLLDDVCNDHPKSDHVEEGLRMFLDEQQMDMVFKHRYMEGYRK